MTFHSFARKSLILQVFASVLAFGTASSAQLFRLEAPAEDRPADLPPTPPATPAPPPTSLLDSTGGSLFLPPPTPVIGPGIRPDGGTLVQRPPRPVDGAPVTPPTPAAGTSVHLLAVPTPPPRVIRRHDLITIIVREQSEFASRGASDLAKQAAFAAIFEQFLKLDIGFDHFAVRNAIGEVKPEIKLSGTRDFSGDGSVDRRDTLTARIQAEVLDVKPNGNLVLVAQKRIRTDDETQHLVLVGTCRAADVTIDNTVLSTQLADLDLTKGHEGLVRAATKRGVLPRLLDRISPF